MGGRRSRVSRSNKVPHGYLKRAAKLKKNWGKTIWVVNKQKKVPTNRRGLRLDAARPTAKPPGWRVSKSGNLYFENRRNRSDKPGSKI